MKKSIMVGIIIILILLAGIFLLSSFSPLNKVSVNGEGIKMPKGYSVLNTSKTGVTITNGTNNLTIYSSDNSMDLNKDTKAYQKKYEDEFNVTINKLESNKTEVYKTVAKPKGKKVTLYWFNHDNKAFKIRTDNAVNGTDDVALKIISSMN